MNNLDIPFQHLSLGNTFLNDADDLVKGDIGLKGGQLFKCGKCPIWLVRILQGNWC